jgi:ElaA protein
MDRDSGLVLAMHLTFRVVPWSELDAPTLYEILRLRSEVFVVEQSCPFQDMDGLDHSALHVLGTADSGALEAYARILPPGLAYPKAASIGRVITSPRVRGMGFGHILMEASIEETRRAFGGRVAIQIGAQEYALPFYEKLGFRISGPTYLEDGIPHAPMVLTGGTVGT